MSAVRYVIVEPNPEGLLSKQTANDLGILIMKFDWRYYQKLRETNTGLLKSALDQSRQHPMSHESDEFIMYLRALSQIPMIKLRFQVGLYIIDHGMDPKRVTALIGRTFLYLFRYLRKPRDQKHPDSFDSLQCFLRTLIETVRQLENYEVVEDYDSCPYLDAKDEKRHFVVWMRCARSAAQPEGDIEDFARTLASSFEGGFGVVGT